MTPTDAPRPAAPQTETQSMTDTRGGAGGADVAMAAETPEAVALGDAMDKALPAVTRTWAESAALVIERLAADGWALSRSRLWLAEHRCFGTEGHDGDHAF